MGIFLKKGSAEMGSIKENQNQAEEPWYVLREMPEKEGESSLELYAHSMKWNWELCCWFWVCSL